jgi:pyruvate formate lyase activating enzyme
MEWIPIKQILNHLYRVRNFLTGIVIGGGEPTIHNQLLEIAYKIKSIGLDIKLDTNGTRPKRIRKMMDENVVDYIALDVKAPIDKYFDVVQNKVDITVIEESIKLLRRGNVDYEFGTTVVPGLVESNELEELAMYLIGSKRFVIRQFKPGNCLDPKFDLIQPFNHRELIKMKELISPYFSEVKIEI